MQPNNIYLGPESTYIGTTLRPKHIPSGYAAPWGYIHDIPLVLV